MAGVSVSGVGSGIDLAALLNKLIDAEKSGPTQLLDARQSTAQASLSTLGTIKSALADLQAAVKNLKVLGAFAKHSATSADPTLFTAAADQTALPNTYNVEVQSLAQAAKLASGAFASTSTVVGTGTLTLSVGGSAFSITVDSSNNTLAGIRDAINAATGNTGVQASILTANDGAHLVLTGTQTGTDHAITVTQSGGDGGLAALVYDPGVTQNLTVQQAAADATVVIDGFTYTSHGNSITGAIGGVTLSLVGAAPGTTKTLTIAGDTGAVKQALQDFVAAYNKVVTVIGAATNYNPDTKVAAPLAGDALPREVAGRLRSLLGSAVSGLADSLNALSDIGITTGTDGTLSIDGAKLDASLSGSFAGVAALFTSSNGLATSLDTQLDTFLGTGGLVANREDALNARLASIADDRQALQRRLDSMEARLRLQFSALDALVAQMNSTSSFLTQQLAGLSGGKSGA